MLLKVSLQIEWSNVWVYNENQQQWQIDLSLKGVKAHCIWFSEMDDRKHKSVPLTCYIAICKLYKYIYYMNLYVIPKNEWHLSCVFII